MLKGLLSTSTTSVFYKTTVSRRAIAGGKNTELMTKESDKWTTNKLAFKEPLNHQGQREAIGNTLSGWRCDISALPLCS